MTVETRPQPELEQSVLKWLIAEANRQGIAREISPTLVKRDGQWLHIAVGMPGLTDVLLRAGALQALEDAWDEQEPRPYWKLLLIPATG